VFEVRNRHQRKTTGTILPSLRALIIVDTQVSPWLFLSVPIGYRPALHILRRRDSFASSEACLWFLVLLFASTKLSRVA
jgi:hypothetical protein